MWNGISPTSTRTPPLAPTGDQVTPPPTQRRELGDFARRVVVAVLISVGILALALVLWTGIHVLLQAFAGVLFALFLTGLSEWVSKHTRLSYGWSLTVVVASLFVLTGGLGWFLEAKLVRQIEELSEKLPQSLKEVQDYIRQYSWGDQLLQQVPSTKEALSQVNAFSRLTGFIAGVADFLVAVVLIVVVGIFAAAEPALYKAGFLHLVPPPHRPRARQAVETVVFNLRYWLLGQVFLMIVIGTTTAVGLWLLGIPLALTLGLLAGIMEMIPYLGAWIAAIPAALIALLVSPTHVVMVLGLYLGLHLLEGYILLPLVQRRAVDMPPALTLTMQVLLGQLLGLMGLFVAAPLTVAIVVLLKLLYVEDTLGDQAVQVPGEPGK
jgi:predicted PurR-regulated permease PerM